MPIVLWPVCFYAMGGPEAVRLRVMEEKWTPSPSPQRYQCRDVDTSPFELGNPKQSLRGGGAPLPDIKRRVIFLAMKGRFAKRSPSCAGRFRQNARKQTSRPFKFRRTRKSRRTGEKTHPHATPHSEILSITSRTRQAAERGMVYPRPSTTEPTQAQLGPFRKWAVAAETSVPRAGLSDGFPHQGALGPSHLGHRETIPGKSSL